TCRWKSSCGTSASSTARRRIGRTRSSTNSDLRSAFGIVGCRTPPRLCRCGSTPLLVKHCGMVCFPRGSTPNTSACPGEKPCSLWNRTPRTMPALKLLILDANEVIYLHETGLWQAVLSRCEVYLARTIADAEARYYRGSEADEIIDLSDDIAQGRVKVFER